MGGAMKTPGVPPAGGTQPTGNANPVSLLLVGPEEFPMMPLGLEQVSLMPRPFLPSPRVKILPRVDELASPGPATQPEEPGPSSRPRGCCRREAPQSPWLYTCVQEHWGLHL